MSTQQRDPIFESLDRLAGIADADLVGDRMPHIQRRVRVARRRRTAGIVVAAAVLAVGGLGIWHALPSERAAGPVSHPDPTTPTEAVETSPVDDFTTADRLRADLDGDGTDDLVQVLVPKDVQAEHQLLRVTWGTGETTDAALPSTMTAGLVDPVDLDADGDLELVVLAGGGETSETSVFLAGVDAVQQVKTVDAAGHDLPLRSLGDSTAWQTYVGPAGISSYRLVDPTATHFPAPVQVREWSLVGDTLTQSPETVSRCVTFQPATVISTC
jgi:hypothetical protein